jgi:carboxyvinyl-carboxyphosphonate phosphorylmutase
VRICLQGHAPFMAAARAAYETLKLQREQGPAVKIAGAASAELLAQLSRDERYEQWTRDYLGG